MWALKNSFLVSMSTFSLHRLSFSVCIAPFFWTRQSCNNSQTTPGITMHEFPRNRPAVRRKWIKFIQFKRSDFKLLRRITPICVASTSVSAISQNPWNTGTLSLKILPGRLKLKRLYPCGSLGQNISFVFGVRVGHFAATPQSDVVVIWSRDLGVVATLSVRQKMPFFVHL